MKKIDLGQTINTLANLGVIAGIVFLAVELQQNNRLMEADARFNRMIATTESYTIEALEREIAEILLKETAGETLTRLEEFRIQAFWMRVLKVLEWGYIEQPDYVVWTSGQRRNYETYSSYRRAWEGNSGGPLATGKDVFDPRFVEFMEHNVLSR